MPALPFFRDLSLPAVITGFVVVLVGYTSSVAIIFQAAQALGASPAQTTSWLWALGIGMGLASILPSLRYRTPVLAAWSTPGAALIAMTSGIDMHEAIGAFLVSAVLIVAVGLSGVFDRLLRWVPASLASALLAGVLLRFGIEAFAVVSPAPTLVLPMILAFFVGRRFWPRYAVPGVLLLGVAIALAQGSLDLSRVEVALAAPTWMTPTFTLASMFSLALPLFVVTMASQNMPGAAIMRSMGYGQTPVSPIIATTGGINLLLAPFGAFALNLAAITAAIAMGREAHEDADRRYTAAVMAGLFYVLLGLFGGVVAGLFAAFPKALVAALAGLALSGTIGTGLAGAMREESEREPALVTFLCTASGLTLLGVGSAFWGLVAGILLMAFQRSGPWAPRS